MIGECDVFNGWASTSSRSIEAARKAGVPSVLTVASAHIAVQTDLLDQEARRWGIDRATTHPAVIARAEREYEEADMLAVPSEFVRRTLVEKRVRESKIKLIPWGVQRVWDGRERRSSRDGMADDAAAKAQRAEVRKQTQGLRVLFVGEAGLRKGLPYLLAAFDALETTAELRLVGPVDRRLVRKLGGLPDGVKTVGVKTGAELEAEFRDADVFVLPSVEDGYGVVTTEAMAAGLPAIVSTNCGSADAVRDGENGYVVPARDAKALRDRLDALLADAELRRRMGEAAAASVQGWSWEESGAAHVREIYEPLARAREARLAQAA
jgi:glycosyltransferase involved in cell wall biosynthesis